jgi:hypothetical protein
MENIRKVLGKVKAVIEAEDEASDKGFNGRINFGEVKHGMTFEEAAVDSKWVHKLLATALTKGQVPRSQVMFFLYLEKVNLSEADKVTEKQNEATENPVNGHGNVQTNDRVPAESDDDDEFLNIMTKKEARRQFDQLQETRDRLHHVEIALQTLFEHLKLPDISRR